MATIRLLAPGEVPTALLSNVPPVPSSEVAESGISTSAARSDHVHSDIPIRALIAVKSKSVEFEVDFGVGLNIKNATAILSGFSELLVGDSVSVVQSGNVSAGRSFDESEMESFICTGRCEVNGELTFHMNSIFGSVAGIYKFIAIY